METLTSKNGELTWDVISQEANLTKSRNGSHITATCSRCGYEVKGEKRNIRSRAKCPGCSPKPVALKTVDKNNYTTNCRLGQHERTGKEDPRREEALQWVIDWCNKRLGRIENKKKQETMEENGGGTETQAQ